ncbi:MAG: hypothetical protein BAJALOKI1v1_760007 [Promethearchaeota archaeon]|nr:MAG: hypothetical protein BAJALOKI1v1_760007 [Candidatus Lokiarchaeota archaeon]
MNSSEKLARIDKILDRWNDGVCFYCGGTLNGDMLRGDYDDMRSDTFCQNCGKDIDPYDEWDKKAVEAIEKIINDKRFKA